MLYGLPTTNELPKYTKARWKRLTRSAVTSHWSKVLSEDARQRSTLDHCNIDSLSIGQTHPVWDTVDSNTTDVKRGITKVRIFNRKHILSKSNKAKFNKYEVDSKCPLCRLEPEDRIHMIIRCPALNSSRVKLIQEIHALVADQLGAHVWETIATRQLLAALIIDCTKLAVGNLIPSNQKLLIELERLSRRLCYRLHVRRLLELRKLNN